MSAIEATDAAPENGRAPKNDLYRVLPRAIEYRAADSAGAEGETLFGHFAVTNTWTEINSMWEGRFMERFATGAFKKTFKDSRDKIRILFQHGQDPEVGDKPIAAISDLREDDEGAFYEARLLEGVPPLVVAGLREGLYGASFRFASMREEWAEEPGVSDHNPEGLPERTIKEARVMEGGPVTFGAYPQATAGLRSATDNFLILRSADADGRRLLLARNMTVPMLDTRTPVRAVEPVHPADCPGCDLAECEAVKRSTAPSKPDAAPVRTSVPERRDNASSRGPLALPTRTPQAGLNLTTTERKATWPLR